jgi:cardiolipin synthase
MRKSLLVPFLLLAACGDEPTPVVDVCESAARHLESCTGVFLTPPVCDEIAAAQAEDLLARDCGQIAALGAASAGKADGAMCDWFDSGCVADEPIFAGPSCTSSSQCASGSTCVENHCFAGLGSPEARAMIDGLTGTSVHPGNHVAPILENAEARALFVDLVDEAVSSVHVVSLIIEDNATGRATVDALVRAAARGVEVRVIVDSVSEATYGNYDLLKILGDAGVQVIAFNPIAEWGVVRWEIDLWANQRIHEKVMVVDGQVALTGGRNIGDSYLADGRLRDRDVLVTGPAVADLQRLFLTDWDEFTDWERRAGCPLASYGVYCRPAAAGDRRGDATYFPALPAVGDADVRVLHSNPRKQARPDGWVTYLALVRSATKSIKITNAYFVPPQRLRKHLRAAVARGVKVEVVTNSKASNDEKSMWYASINHYEELIKGGVTICEWRGSETVHVKSAVFDDRLAVVASYNLDPRSATTNSESLVLIEGSPVAELAQAWAVDRARCDVSNGQFGFADRMLARIHRIAEPLL